MEVAKKILRVLGVVFGGGIVLIGLMGIIAEEYTIAFVFLAIGAGLLYLSLHRSPAEKAEAAIRAQARRSERLARAEQARADAERRARLASEERVRQEGKRRQQRQAQQAAWHEHVMRQQQEEQARQHAQAQQPPPPRYETVDWRASASTYKSKRQQQNDLRDERKAAARDEGVACCPRCGSTSLSINKKGFGAGKAIVFGPLAGAIGMNRLKITCMNCGYQYRPGKRSRV